MVGMVRVCCFLLKAYQAEMITCADSRILYLCVYAVEVCISVTWTSRVFTRWGYCGKPLSGGWSLIYRSTCYGLVPYTWMHSWRENVLQWIWLLGAVGGVMQKRDTYGAWEHYLGLEHADTAPKRSHAANQVIYNILTPCVEKMVLVQHAVLSIVPVWRENSCSIARLTTIASTTLVQ